MSESTDGYEVRKLHDGSEDRLVREGRMKVYCDSGRLS